LLRNSGNGHMFLWEMNGASLVSSTFVGAEDPAWEVQGF
jgi:hypothetical protein